MRGSHTHLLRSAPRTDRPARSSAGLLSTKILALLLLAASSVLAPCASAISCSTTKVVKSAGGGDCTTIMQCVNGVPAGAFAGNYCIDIQDSATYPEQVTVQGKNPNGFQLAIGAITTANTPIVSPLAASTAAFQILNTSVTIESVYVVPTNAMTYGVWASSTNVTISGVNIIDATGKINKAGVSITSLSLIANSSVAVNSAVAPAILMSQASRVTLTLSTATNTGGFGMQVSTSVSVVIDNSYVSGSQALWITDSTSTVIDASVFVGTNVVGNALWLAGGSDGLTVSTSTLIGGPQGAGARLDQGNSGNINFSTNTIPAGAQYGIYAATQAASAYIVITSNTIVPTFSTAHNTYGMYFDGQWAGIINNGIYYRGLGSMGAFKTYGIYALSASGGMFIDHNRISMSGSLTGGSYEAVALFGSDSASFSYNDVHSTGTLFVNALLLRLANGSTNASVKNNIFDASMTVTGSSATIDVSADSESGFGSNFNDWYSSNAYNTGNWGGTSYSFTDPSWNTATNQDPKSKRAPPLWQVTGVEDFHPRSSKGRWDPTIGAFVNDGAFSQTIDSAKNGDPFFNETAPNGGRANQGSYGNTAEASHSHTPLNQGCQGGATVKQDGTEDYTTIQAAVNSLNTNLSFQECVIIEDTQTYHEQVTIQGFTMNGNAIIIAADETFVTSGPVVSPPAGSTAAIQIMNSNVEIGNVWVLGTNAVPYGVAASSPNIIISSVNVDSGGKILTAGMYLSSSVAVSNSSVTMQSAHGFYVDGVSDSISYSTAQVAGAARYAFFLNGSAATAVSASYATNSAGAAVMVYSGSLDSIDGSTLSGSTGVFVNGSTGTSVTNCALTGTNVGGSGLLLTGGSVGLTMSADSAVGGARGAGVYLGVGNSGTIVLSSNSIVNGAQYGIYAATQSAGTQIFITSNTIVPTMPAAYNTYGLYLNGLTSGATIESNSVYFRASGSMAGFTTYGLYAQSASGLMIDHNRFSHAGTLTGGSLEAAALASATETTFKFNDVHSTGTLFTNAYLLRLTNGSVGTVVKDNIFSASMTVTGSSASISVSADSEGSFSSDYNDWFSSNSFDTGIWGASSYQFPAGWNAASGQDANSIAANPLWQLTSVEDFHPESGNGRWDPTAAAFVYDSVTSPTIDKADPSEPFGQELAPKGGRANQGSTGDTTEASKSVPLLGPGCASGFNVKLDGSADFTTIQAAVNALSTNLIGNECVVIRDTQTYHEQVTIQNFTNNGLQVEILSDPSFISSAPVVSPTAGHTAAFLIMNSSVTIGHISVRDSIPLPYAVKASSPNVTISSMSVDSNFSIGTAGIAISSWSTISYSSVTVQGVNGIYLDGTGDVVAYSTASASGAGFAGAYLNGATYNTFTVFTASNTMGNAVSLLNGANDNSFSQLNLFSTDINYSGLSVVNSSSNSFVGGFYTSANGKGITLGAGAGYNVINQSTMTTNFGNWALELSQAAGNTVADSALNGGAWLHAGAQANALAGDTIVASAAGIELDASLSNTVSNCSVSGSTGVWVRGSTGTVVGSSTLLATNSNGSGIALSGTSSGLTLSSSVVSGGAAAYGINLETNNKGAIFLTSNTVTPGALFAVGVATQQAGTAIYVTSNTILPSLPGYGLYFNGLTSGATVENNGIYYRTPVSAPGSISYGIYAQSASGLAMDHNIISMPGMLIAGSYEAVSFYGTTGSAFKFNDVLSTGTGLTSAYLVRLFNGSTPIVIKDNIFLASMTVTASSASIIISADSEGFLFEDYNDWFSPNSANTGVWGASNYQFLGGWQAGSGQDVHSIAADPLWFNPGAGVEDFHPQSINGRWNPVSQTFVDDGVTSPTIDMADPAEPFSLEPIPNNGRANQGSTGDTPQASISPEGLAPGCSSGFNVKQDGTENYTTIMAAVNALNHNMPGTECVIIKDTQTYTEQVTIQGFVNNGYQLTIMADPSFVSTAPVINPPVASTAAFQIMNTSVTLYHLMAIPTHAVTYGVSASSAYVTITSMSVDSGGRIWGAGIAVSSWTMVSGASVTVQAGYGLLATGSTNTISASSFGGSAAGIGLYFDGSSSNTVSGCFISSGAVLSVGANDNTFFQSTMTSIAANIDAVTIGGAMNDFAQCYIGGANGNAVNIANGAAYVPFTNITQSTLYSQAPLYYALASNQASSTTISQSVVANPNGSASLLVSFNGGTITQSTFTAGGVGGRAYWLNSGSSNTVTQSVIGAPNGGVGVTYQNSATYNTISFSSVTGASNEAVDLQSASYNLFSRVYVQNVNGYGLRLATNAKYNTISLSTITAVGGFPGVFVSQSSSNTLVDSYVQGSTGVYVSGSTGTIIGNDVIAATGTAGSALWLDAGSVNLFVSSSVFLGGGNGSGIYLDKSNQGAIYLSTNVILTGAEFGISVATQAGTTQLFITSNTIVPTVGTGVNTYGLYINGLASGATIENNTIVYRTAGSMGAATAYGIYAQSTAGLLFDRDRIIEPGLLTGGGFTGVDLVGAAGTTFKFNDILAAGTSLTNAYLMLLTNGCAGAVIKDDVFEASMTVTGSSASISVSADSEGGFSSDYNDWFSSNSLNAGVWGGAGFQFLAGWRAGSGQDTHSIAANPLWQVTSTEDLHPRSMRGRYDPTVAGFTADAATSLTIDAADPTEASFAVEPAPNGGRANQGSYGGTAQASETAPPPTNPVVAGVVSSSITLSWGAVASDGYRADAALVADFSAGLISSATAVAATTQLAPQGLAPNTTYYLRAGALYGSNYNFAAAVPVSTVTLAAAPAAPIGVGTFTAVTINSFTLNWSSGTAGTGYNPMSTLYVVQISTMANFAPVAASSLTFNISASFGGLMEGFPYFAEVQAANVSGGSTTFTNFGSTATMGLQPGAASPAFSAILANALTANWTANGNAAGTTYYAQISTMATFNPIMMSSQTYNLNATFVGLNANTTYFLQAAAFNLNASTWTAFTNIGSTSSLAAAPAAPALAQVNLSSVGFNWSANGDPVGTIYVAQISTDNFLSVSASSQTLNPSVTFFNLVSNDTYFLEVEAVNSNNLATSFTALPSTWTLAAPPASAALSTIGLSSVTVNWLANNDSTTTIYLAQISTDGFATVNLSSQTLNLSTLFGAGGSGLNLSPNTTYYFQTKAVANGGLSTTFTSLGSTMTLAANPAPAIATFTAVAGNGLTLNWSSGSLATGYNAAQTFYLAQISTMASFIPLAASSQTFNTSVAFAGLNPNFTYFAQVLAINGTGLYTAFVNFGSTATPTAVPGAPGSSTFTAILANSFTLNWSADGNQAGTTYYAQISTMPTFVPIVLSSQTYNVFASFAGLNTNTTYYAQAAAYNLNSSTWTTFDNLTATSTLANAPSAPALAQVDFSSVSISWGANGDPAWTNYFAQISTDNFATINASSLTLNTSAFFTALQSNATYYFKVRALNNYGAATAFVAAPTTWTVVSAPIVAQPSAVGTTQITSNWATGDGAFTNYIAQVSTDNFVTVNATSQTFNTSVVFSGLVSNATYYFQAKAIGNNGLATSYTALPSTWTSIALPIAAAPTTVGLSSMTANWGPNGDTLSTIYIAQISTDNFTTVNASSQTLNAAVLFTGLNPNASYYTQVQVLGYDGRATAFVSLPSTMTLAADPAPAIATFTAVGGNALTLNWSSGTLATGYNTAQTIYLAQISTMASFNPLFASSQTLNTSAPFSGLIPNDPYFAQVKAINGLGLNTVFVNFGSTQTPTAPPGLAAPVFTAIGINSLTANWTSDGNPAGTTYYAQISTMASFNPILMSSQTYNLLATFAGLNINTTYYAQAAAYNLATTTWTAFTNLTATSTLANAPLAPALAQVDFSSVSISWGANGDPAWTNYFAQISTDNFATVNASSLTLNASAFFTALQSNATYFFKVRALNSEGAATVFVAAPTTWTVVSAPVSAAPAGITTTQIAANWTTIDAAFTNYITQISTDNFATVNATSQTFNTSVVFSGLVSNATYYFQAKAIGNNGLATSFTALPSTWTAIALPLAAAPTTVGLSSATANWGANGDAVGTIFIAQISTDNFATVNASSQTLNVTVLFPGLNPNASYYTQVQVLGYDGRATAFVSLPSTMTLAADPAPAIATFTAVGGNALTLNWSSGTLATGYNTAQTFYLAQISTMASFIPLSASSQTFNTSVAFGGLTPNSPYFAQVKAINGLGLNTAFVNFGSTSTPTAAPGAASPVFTAITNNALTVNWTSNGNQAGTTYYAQISTMASFNPILVSSQTYNLFASFVGLNTNATYYAQAAAYNLNTTTWTAFTNLTATSTLASAPLAPALAQVDFSSVSIIWGANGDPAWTNYFAQISTDNFATVNASSLTLNASAFFKGLQSNATYYFTVRALNNEGAATAFVAAPTTWTVVSAPVSAAPSGITTSQITANWTTTDAALTNFVAQISTDNFATVNATSQTLNTSIVFSGLAPNTTYYFKTKAIGNNGLATAFTALPSTWTLISPPLSAPPTTVGLSSMTANWGANGNSLGTIYLTAISTDNFATVNATSQTLNTSALFSGLNPNASYYTEVEVLGFGGQASGFTALPLTMTMAADPGPAVSTFTAVGGNSLTINWSSGTLVTGYNSAQTIYLAQISTMASFIPLSASSQTENVFATFSGLTPQAPYFAEVKAINGLGLNTAFVNLGSTTTPIAPPSPAAPVFTAVLTAGLQVNWTANGNPAGTTYYAQISTMATLTPILLSSQTLNLFAAFPGLSANTTYFAQAAAYNINTSTWTAFTNLGSTSTLAKAPILAALLQVDLSSISVSWGTNGNPAYTTYAAQLSTDNFATVNITSQTLGTSATFFGLVQNSTYYVQVQALNSDGVGTAFDSVPSTWTQYAQPIAANPSFVGSSSITANWLANGNPATTVYSARISTDNFATVNSASETINAFATFPGLNANTTYYFKVQVVAYNGQGGPFVVLPSTVTLLLPPGAAANIFTAVNSNSLTANWTTGGNGAGTTYYAQISTDNFATINLSSSTLNLSVALGAGGAGPNLTPNTTYYGRVQATNASGSSAFLALGSTMTLAAPPAAAVATFTAVTGSGLTLNWSSGTFATGYDPAQTSYLAQISTMASFNPLAASSQTFNINASFAGLAADSVYFARVQAVNGGGTATAFVIYGSTATPTASPGLAAPVFTAILANSFTINWTANGNPSGTTYYAQISTMASLNPIVMSSQTYNLFAAFAGLGTNTTYYAQAAAFNINTSTWTAFTNLTATSTLANAPLSPALAQVDFSSVSISWGANGDPAWTNYLAQVSTDNFATVNASSLTLNASAFFTGLQSNATYYFKVLAFNNDGAATAFVFAPSTWTLVSAPISAAPTGDGTTMVTANWTSNDAAGTYYAAQISTDNFATVNSSSVTLNLSAVFAGLNSNTTYYFQAKAIGNNGQSTAYTVLPTTMTLLLGPGVAGTSFTTIGTSSMTVNWTSGGNGVGTTYVTQISTDNFGTINASSSTFNLAALFGTGGLPPALTPNTTYYARTQAVNGSDVSAFTALGSAFTYANPPTGSAISNVQITSATLSWALNQNPAATVAEVQRSTDSVTYATAFSGAFSNVTDSTLLECSTYYYRVRNRNFAGLPTAFDATVSFVTQGSTPSAPSALVAASLAGNQIALSWSPSPSPVRQYFLYYDAGTGAVNYGAPLATIAAPTTAYTTGVLPSTASYRFAIRAENHCGIIETNTSVLATSASTATLSAVSAAVESPVAGTRVTGNRVTLYAHLTSGTAAQTSQVLFEYKATTDTVWHLVPAAEGAHPNPSLAPPFFVHWDLTSQPATNYDLRTIAYDVSGATDTALGSITIVADPVAWDVNEISLGGGMIQRRQVISNSVDNTVTAGDGASSMIANIVIPAGALSTSSTTITVVPNPGPPAPPPGGVGVPNLGVSILLGNGQTMLSGGQLGSISFSYQDPNKNGTVGATGVPVSQLKVFSYNAVSGNWQQDAATTLDTVNELVFGLTPHFSFFSAFGVPPTANLGTIRIYPNPFKPNGPNSDEGRPFNAADPNSGIIIDNLPADYQIKIYTISGSLVAHFNSLGAGAGKVQWDAKNDMGKDVASGIYFVVITSQGTMTATRKVAILR